jgi:mono/diheme cytochrome c family protein
LVVIFLVIFVLLGWYWLENLDPYVQDVLSLSGKVSQGKAIFEANCAICHGLDGRGNIGPSLEGVSQRKSQSGLINQVISGKTPPMPKFQPNSQAMADLLSYLESL